MATKRNNKRGLGKGLEALIPGAYSEDNTAKTADAIENIDNDSDADSNSIASKDAKERKDGVIELDINTIEPNVDQPRKHFDDDKIAALADSIKEHGIIQPIIVKKEVNTYRIIAGERRWRASKFAGLTKIPVIIKDISEKELMELSLIENIQREDLNPIEEAEAYERLINEFNFTQEELGKSVGKNRTTITNSLRLLKLNDKVKSTLIYGDISMGHARALLSLENDEVTNEVLDIIISKELSVRETEKLIKSILTAAEKKPKETEDISSLQEAISSIENRLMSMLSTKVKVDAKKDKGKIVIEYFSNDELDRIMELFEKAMKE